MAVAASAVVAVGAVTGVMSASAGEGDHRNAARPTTTATPVPGPLPARPTASATPTVKASAPASRPAALPSTEPPRASRPAPPASSPTRAPGKPEADRGEEPGGAALYRHPESQVLDWVRANGDDPRHALIASRIAERPAAVWFAAYDPGAVTARVRSVTSAAEAAGRVPVLVPYAIPDRDCGGASQGGAPDLAAYDDWIGDFAAGLGGGEVVVVLEPDSIALSDCLSTAQRQARFASLARAGRTLHAANPRAKVYFDAGHSGWHSAGKQAAALRAAGARSSGDGIFTNVANFHRTADEAAYARRVLAALGGPPGLGAVIDTSRNGNGPPAEGQWCDPAGRALGRAPTTRTGEDRIDAYLWVKLPGESDGCKGAAGTFAPDYAYQLARGD
ncbi:glycoside hydrolase family 6 protein [Streptomyces chryseus]|uniref:Glucanase n=2 Tax=Streptomyces chryseus TaxID=68186 RepID=A0ABQ3DH66_9ACTN|nr:glycoside hydrolase family 6 protein [Streptomyces chryseus]GGW89580.1 glucanase [Streptomyces chryseus]GHA91362.1 glucanase [Streptomyces chryseus]